jgi:CubicO group peptidase (beta-lactamase class C family)
MRKILLLVLAAGSLLPLPAQQSTVQKLDELMKATTEVYKFNGSVLVSKNGQVLLYKGYGRKNISDSTWNDSATVYQIASVTKQFTSAVIFKLIELKKFSLTDPVSRFYPDWRKGDSITIENLLTHTSGIDDQRYNGPDKPMEEEDTLVAALGKNPLLFTPGTQFRYSNKGYQLLGYIIQRVSGMTYYEAVRHYIFEPLDMTRSGFDFVHLTSKDKAAGYYYFSDSVCPKAPIIDSATSFSAGAIYSTMGDLYKWLTGVSSYRIIGRPSLEKAWTPLVNPHYGYGWQIDTFFNKRVVYHGGDIWGFKSNIAMIPEDNIMIVLLENTEAPPPIGIIKKITAILYDQPYPLPARNMIRPDRNIMEKYAGMYEMPPNKGKPNGLIIKMTVENGHLISTTDRREEMYVQKENFFILDNGDSQLAIEFEMDAEGKVTDLSFYKQGEKIICKKIR